MLCVACARFMSDFIPKLMTIGELAIRLGVSTHRLKYAIDQYHIEPTRRVGIIRVWSEDQIFLIESALSKIGRKRGPRICDPASAEDQAIESPPPNLNTRARSHS